MNKRIFIFTENKKMSTFKSSCYQFFWSFWMLFIFWCCQWNQYLQISTTDNTTSALFMILWMILRMKIFNKIRKMWCIFFSLTYFWFWLMICQTGWIIKFNIVCSLHYTHGVFQTNKTYTVLFWCSAINKLLFCIFIFTVYEYDFMLFRF